MKRFFSSFQGLIAGILAILLFLNSPAVIHYYDGNAGVFDAGFLQWIILATAVYLWGVFVVWLGWQIAFRSMDQWADKHLRAEFERLPGPAKIFAVQFTFVLMAIGWFVALKIVPLTS